MQHRLATDHGPAWLVQAAEVARLFYVDSRSKVEIADLLGMSRFRVARILEDARELGLVKVTIRLPAAIDAEASAAVKRHTGARAIVLSADTTGDVRQHLGRLGADLLSERAASEDVLGFTCSRSVSAACSALRSLSSCDVIQLTGTLAGRDGEPGSVESVRRAAAVGGGRQFPIYAPMVLPDAQTTRGLGRQEAIRHVLDRIPTVTIALVAIGGWSQETSTAWESATPADHVLARDAGAVGEIGGRLFDARGRAAVTELDDRVLGLGLEQLRSIPEVIALAHGSGRAAAAHAAITGGLVDTLVCDHAVARGVLDLPPVREAS